MLHSTTSETTEMARTKVRLKTYQTAAYMFPVALNGDTVTVAGHRHPDELEVLLRKQIASWGLEKVLELTRDGNAIKLARVDGGPEDSWPDPGE